MAKRPIEHRYVEFPYKTEKGDIVDGVIINSTVHLSKDCPEIAYDELLGINTAWCYIHRPNCKTTSIKMGRGAWAEVSIENDCLVCFAHPKLYSDILSNWTFETDWNFPNTKRHANMGYKDRCLVWTENNETATMHINSEIHPAAVSVWFEMIGNEQGHFIEVYELRNSKWKLVETSFGVIKYTNNNPFPNVPSVFKQNQRRF